MIKWTGLAPWEFEFLLPGSLTSTFLASAESSAEPSGTAPPYGTTHSTFQTVNIPTTSPLQHSKFVPKKGWTCYRHVALCPCQHRWPEPWTPTITRYNRPIPQPLSDEPSLSLFLSLSLSPVSLYFSVSLCLSLSLWLSFCLCLSLSLSLTHTHTHTHTLTHQGDMGFRERSDGGARPAGVGKRGRHRQCIHQLVLESQLPHKTVDLTF